MASILRVTDSNTALPSVFGENLLAADPTCIACFDGKTIGDQSGHGHNMLGVDAGDFGAGGLILPGAVSGFSIDLVMPSYDWTFIGAIKVDNAAAADGYVISDLDLSGNVGNALRWNVGSGGQYVAQAIPASGTIVGSTPLTRAKNIWHIMAFRTMSAPPAAAVNFLTSNTGGSATSAVIGARNAPLRTLMLGDNRTSTKGVIGILGVFGVFNTLMSQASMNARIADIRTEMLRIHGAVIP
jgi:hypothetical protein